MGDLEVPRIFQCIPEIDFDSGYRYFLRNMDNYKRALLAILKSVKSKLPILYSMASTREYEGLPVISRTLQIMFSNIGAKGLSHKTYQLEAALLNYDMAFQNTLEDYIISLEDFTKNLEELLKKLELNKDIMKETKLSFLNYDFTKTKESIKLSSDLLERKTV